MKNVNKSEKAKLEVSIQDILKEWNESAILKKLKEQDANFNFNSYLAECTEKYIILPK